MQLLENLNDAIQAILNALSLGIAQIIASIQSILAAVGL